MFGLWRCHCTPVCPFRFILRATIDSPNIELLREEKEDVDIAGPTLSSLKTILDDPPLASDKDGLSRYSRLIHGLLSACLVNIDEMR